MGPQQQGPQAETRGSPPGGRGLATIPGVCWLTAGFSVSEVHAVRAVGPSGPTSHQDPPGLTHHGAQRGAHRGPHAICNAALIAASKALKYGVEKAKRVIRHLIAVLTQLCLEVNSS